MSHAALSITDSTFSREIEASPGLTIVDCWAEWCASCRVLGPVVDQIAAERGGSVKVTKLDLDANIRTSTRFNVRSAPTLLFFKDGQLVDRIIGAAPKTKIDAVIARHVG